MASRYLLAPAADRAKLRRVIQRVDQVLGYPRTHADDEPDVQRAPGAAPPYTEAAFAVYLHDDTGPTILHGAIGVRVNGLADELKERLVNVDGVTKRLREWIADQGWELRPDLPGSALAWSRVAPRDGAEGSTTGRPIPEEGDDGLSAARAGDDRR